MYFDAYCGLVRSQRFLHSFKDQLLCSLHVDLDIRHRRRREAGDKRIDSGRSDVHAISSYVVVPGLKRGQHKFLGPDAVGRNAVENLHPRRHLRALESLAQGSQVLGGRLDRDDLARSTHAPHHRDRQDADICPDVEGNRAVADELKCAHDVPSFDPKLVLLVEPIESPAGDWIAKQANATKAAEKTRAQVNDLRRKSHKKSASC